MLSDLVRVLRSRIRSVLTLVVDLNRGQLLKDNRSLNRLFSVRNLDLDLLRAVCCIRDKGLLALTENSLLISLRDQLCLKGVLLTRNQVLIGNGIDYSRVVNDDLLRSFSKLGLGLDRRGLGFPLVAWQAWLIRWEHTLTLFRAYLPRTVRSHNRNKSIRRLGRNLNRRIHLELVIQIRSSILHDSKARQLCKLVRASFEVLEANHIIRVTISKVSFNNVNCCVPTRRVRDNCRQVSTVLSCGLFIARSCSVTKLNCQTNCSILILRIFKFQGTRRGLRIAARRLHRIWGSQVDTPGPANIISRVSFSLSVTFRWNTRPHKWAPRTIAAHLLMLGA